MSGKKILKYSSLSLGIFIAGAISGYSINYIHEDNTKEIEERLLSLKELDSIDGLSVEDSSKVVTIETDSGDSFYALYKDNFFGGISDVRYVLGDGYLVYNNNVMRYIEKMALENSKDIPNVKNNGDLKPELETEESPEENVVNKENQSNEDSGTEEKNNENKTSEEDGNEVNNSESNSNGNESEQESSSVDVSELIVDEEESGRSEGAKTETNNVETENNRSEISSDTFVQDDTTQNENDSSQLDSGEFRKTEEQKEERVVEELEFVDENVSGTTRDRVLTEDSPDNETREKIKEEVSSAADENYRREAVKQISEKISEFTIDFESQTNEEKRIITVFTDPTCPYCKRLHGDIERMQLNGYTVRYLLIPRDGMNSPVVPEMTYASCLPKDKSKEMVRQLYSGNNLDISNMPESCDSRIIERQLTLATSLGAENTPFIIDNKGGVTQGYSGIDDMIKNLDESN